MRAFLMAAVTFIRKTVKLMSENMDQILGKLTELLQMTRAGKDIFEIVKVNEKAVIVYNHGEMDIVNIECDSGIAAIYDIVKKLVF